ncbi:MAG: hypothetical protein FWD60_00935 [Candidatus Azobacteroides sp.]|nr:hypothetical protein [Candidatus Azobacteroides sp.]
MDRITGITVEHTSTGHPQFVRIDLRKHADFIPMLEKKGVELSPKQDSSKKPAVTCVPPRGYVTLEQFAEDTKRIINDYCDARDIH